ncbi:MAG: 50S ribosomal protein L34e [Candidatus Aenigmatarchaeota archaeon]|nr:MAG: 50S ribosomal protein L34e [Candidatus Aenigmarchaeota archaeon]
MPRPALRSRTLRRVKKRLPGGGFIIHYLKRKPSPAKCAVCGRKLHGVPRKSPSIIKKISKSKKTPSRPYGGNLCSRCAREKVKENLR